MWHLVASSTGQNLRRYRKYAEHMCWCLKLLWNLKLDIQMQAFPRSVKEKGKTKPNRKKKKKIKDQSIKNVCDRLSKLAYERGAACEYCRFQHHNLERFYEKC